MARKKRKDEEKAEEYEWVRPEFDEEAFLKKDIVGTKALMYTTVVALIFGGLSAAISDYAGHIVGIVMYLAGLFVMNYTFKYARIKVEDIDKKTSIGNIALYMLLALGVWIFFINEPFI